MVSVACLAGWQTILECFSRSRTVGSQEKKRDTEMDGKLKTQLDAF